MATNQTVLFTVRHWRSQSFSQPNRFLRTVAPCWQSRQLLLSYRFPYRKHSKVQCELPTGGRVLAPKFLRREAFQQWLEEGQLALPGWSPPRIIDLAFVLTPLAHNAQYIKLRQQKNSPWGQTSPEGRPAASAVWTRLWSPSAFPSGACHVENLDPRACSQWTGEQKNVCSFFMIPGNWNLDFKK